MAECASCGKEYGIWDAALGEGICADCSKAQKEAEAQAWKKRAEQDRSEAGRQRAEEAVRQPQTKYPALRAIVGIYYLLACLVGIATVVLVLGALSQESVAFAGAWFLGGSLGVISCVAAAELIKVLLDTEENTRNCYSALWQSLNK